MFLLIILLLKILNCIDYSKISCSMTNANPAVKFNI